MSTLQNEITVFDDLAPQEFHFEYLGKRYILHEASGGVAKKFQNERTNRFRFNDKGKIEGVRDAADLVPMLVTLCVKTDQGSAVPQSIVEAWPDRLLQKLFKKAKEISGIDEGVLGPAEILDSLFKEPGCPIDQPAFINWMKTLKDEKYEGLQKKFTTVSAKES